MDTVIREIESKNGKRLARIIGEDIEDEEMERMDEHAKKYLEHVDQILGDNIIRAVPKGSTNGLIEYLIRKRLEEADLLGKSNSPELRDSILEIVSDLLKQRFPSHKYEIEVGGYNRNGQVRVTVGLSEDLMEKNKIEVEGLKEKIERRKNQTTMDEDFINFLIG